MLSQAQFLAAGGVNCPACGSEDWEAGSMDFDGAEVSQTATCSTCGATYEIVYTLARFRIVYPAEVQFRPVFLSPYEQYAEHVGKRFTVLRLLTDEERDPEVGRMYLIRLEDGTEVEAWPEEVEEGATWTVHNGEPEPDPLPPPEPRPGADEGSAACNPYNRTERGPAVFDWH